MTLVLNMVSKSQSTIFGMVMNCNEHIIYYINIKATEK